jgi:enterochelin esterase family protein
MSSWFERLQQHPYARDLLNRATTKLDRLRVRLSDSFWQRWQELEAEPDLEVARAGAQALYEWVAQQEMPLVEGGRVTFVYFGEGDRSVRLVGDWNGWNPDAEPMRRLGKTALFAIERRLPIDARLGYQFVIDGVWGPDPRNPHRQIVLGEHSIVQMPGFQADPALREGEVPRGVVETLQDTDATPLAARPIHVYLPRGYDDAGVQRYPVLYLHDGTENLERGRLPDVFDRLIARGVIPPMMAVFIPNAGVDRNREYTPYFSNSLIDVYREYVVKTVIPGIDRRFKTQAERAGRMMLGQSFGGTISFYIGYHHPELFGCVAGQSGVYMWPEMKGITDLYLEGERRDFRAYLDSTMFRAEPAQSQSLARAFHAKAYPFTYTRRPTGHSYESWRFWIPEALRYWLREG